MCLAILGKLIEKSDKEGLSMGTVDYGGRTSKVCLSCTPDLQLGQYTIVHAGFTLTVFNEDEILQCMEIDQEMTADNGIN